MVSGAAQERGEVASGREGRGLGVARDNAQIATAADLGLRRNEIRHRAERRIGELIAAQREAVGLSNGGRPYQSTGSKTDPVEPDCRAGGGARQNR
jgi:hypothetical protein